MLTRRAARYGPYYWKRRRKDFSPRRLGSPEVGRWRSRTRRCRASRACRAGAGEGALVSGCATPWAAGPVGSLQPSKIGKRDYLPLFQQACGRDNDRLARERDRRRSHAVYDEHAVVLLLEIKLNGNGAPLVRPADTNSSRTRFGNGMSTRRFAKSTEVVTSV
jgi:hypothetical protein